MSRVTLAIFVLALVFFTAPAQSAIVVTVDKTAQRLTVEVDGTSRYRWPVSTGRWGYNTPNGSYRPQRLARKWFSRKYDWSPMPYSIFFNEGYAIHGSYEVSRLGRPASHGCIRLPPRTLPYCLRWSRIIRTKRALLSPAKRLRRCACAMTVGKSTEARPTKVFLRTPGTAIARARTGRIGDSA